MRNINFKNKSVVITGGTRGIGAHIAKTFLKLDAKVIVLARNRPKKLIQAKGNKAIDILINNAGGSPLAKTITASPKFHQSIIDLNFTAPLNVSQKIAKIMIKQKTVSNIINISSVTATRPTPGSAAYGASKGALVNLSKTLAVEWAPKIKVNSIIVGYIETENSILHYGGKRELAKVAKKIPLKRMGRPQDVADACVFFASDLAKWVTGSSLEVHGGGEIPSYLEVAKPK